MWPALLGLLVGCPAPYAVWLSQGSTAEDLVFGMATKRGGSKVNPLLRVVLTTCYGYMEDLRRLSVDTLWLSQSLAEFPQGPRVARLRYGEPIVEHHDSVPPRRLRPGCHHVSVSSYPGSADLSFIIEPNGTARELSRSERDSVADSYTKHRNLEYEADRRANAACREAYKEAGSGSDSILVDSIVPYDTTRFSRLTCAILRQIEPQPKDSQGKS
jgi:hypothetical protein